MIEKKHCIDEEHLLPEDTSKRPHKSILFYILSLFFILLLFSLFSLLTGRGTGGGIGGGVGEGAGPGSGAGTGPGSGNSAGNKGGVGNDTGVAVQNIEKSDSTKAVHKKNGQETAMVSSTSDRDVSEKKEEISDSSDNVQFSTHQTFTPFKVKITQKTPPPAKKEPQVSVDETKETGSSSPRGGGGGQGKVPGTGDISFRIHWTPAIHDIDLHVIDPNGHELFFQNKFCPCKGELDIDDTNHGGPENIFWPTGKAPHGNYKFFVVYYNGYGAEKVNIEVRKGGKIFKTYSISLARQGDKSEIFSVNY